jgi:hypothetical protein
MRTRLRGKMTLLFMTFALLLAIPAVALAAELATTAEVDSNAVTQVTVTQGQSTNFNIKVAASGNVAAGSTHWAKVMTRFDVAGAGVVTPSVLSDQLNFSASSGTSTNVPITGGPYNVSASVHAASDAEPGTYEDAIVLSEAAGTTTTSSSNTGGGKLDDTVETPIDVVVLEAQQSSSCTFSNILQPVNADGSSAYKFGAKGVIPAKFTATCDGNPVDTQAEADAFKMKLTLTHLTGGQSGQEAVMIEDPVTGSANTGSLFRFDDAADQFIYNVNIKGLAKGNYKIGISPNDSSVNGSGAGYFSII